MFDNFNAEWSKSNYPVSDQIFLIDCKIQQTETEFSF